MPKYMVQVSYVGEGIKGLLRDGGSKRREVVGRLFQSVGATIEAFYYAFGEDDLVIIADVPDNVSTAALVLTVTATGTVKVKTTVLLTPEEVDQAARKSIEYSPPGQ